MCIHILIHYWIEVVIISWWQHEWIKIQPTVSKVVKCLLWLGTQLGIYMNNSNFLNVYIAPRVVRIKRKFLHRLTWSFSYIHIGTYNMKARTSSVLYIYADSIGIDLIRPSLSLSSLHLCVYYLYCCIG